MKTVFPALSALAVSLFLSGCSTPSPESLAQNDPWEKTNRDIFDFDVRVDHAVARPIAKGYRAVVPEPVRDGIHNALTNLNSPVVLANDVLQGDGSKAVRRFEELGCIVEEASPDIGAADEAFHILRSQHFIVDRELQLRSHRDKLKPDIIWNTERGLAQTLSDLARADRERAAFYRRMIEFFGTYDLLVTPGAATPAFDVNLRNAPTIGGRKPDNYMGGSTLTAVITLTACPAMAVPCGFDPSKNAL